MAADNGRGKESNQIFFSLMSTVMIVLSNAAFQQYALYKLEADRIEVRIEKLKEDYDKSLMMESIIEIKNTLVVSHMVMSSQKNVLEGLEHILAKEYNTTDNTTSEAIEDLANRNKVLVNLMDEITNISAYVSSTAPDLEEYDKEISNETETLNKLKLDSIEKGGIIRESASCSS